MKFLQADEISIAALLHKALTVVEPARPLANLHASALTRPDPEFCPREVILSRKLNRKPYPQRIAAPMQVTFHEGKDTQARFNNYWLRNLMVGNWRCQSCQEVHKFCKAPLKCAACSSKHLIYEEVVFYHQSSGAQGSLDAILDVGKPKLRLVEVKIMAVDEWVKLKAPLGEHRARSKLYLEIIDGSSHPGKQSIDTSRIHVLYKLRGYGKKDETSGIMTPFKEFVVFRDPAEIQLYLTMASTVKQSMESDWALIPTGICSTMFDSRAKICPIVKECFSGLFTPNLP